jgi:hypothetical protein
MPFPWGQSTLPSVTFTCPHCGDVKAVIRESVAVCDCPGSQQQAAEDRERARVHHRAQEDARKARMKLANERRRKLS